MNDDGVVTVAASRVMVRGVWLVGGVDDGGVDDDGVVTVAARADTARHR